MTSEELKDYIDPALKVSAAVIVILYLKKIAKIFMGPDGRFSTIEFGKFAGFIIFTYLAIYMIHKEAVREHEWPLFSEFHVLIVFSSLLAILHLDTVMDKVVKMMELLLKMRMKGKVVEEEKTT